MISVKIYPRRDELFKFGVRNHVLVASVGASANHAVMKIARIANTPSLVHSKGTDGELGEDSDTTRRTIINTVLNPNVYSAVLVGLGDERHNARDMAAEIESFKPVSWLHIQEIGENSAISRGIRLVKNMRREAKRTNRKNLKDIKGLTIGVKCGASDFSSVFANAVVGIVSDTIVRNGGKVVFTETTELIGMENHLAKRCKNSHVKRKLRKSIKDEVKAILSYSKNWLGAQPNYGNIRGGITTIEEKSAAAVLKTGTSNIVDVIRYGDRISKNQPGVYFVNGPGFDVPAITALAAAGCHAIVFTTGSGEPIGSPVAPTIKVTANDRSYQVMRENIDLCLSPPLKGVSSLEDQAGRLFNFLLKVVIGERTAAERLGHQDFAILKTGPTL